MRTISVADILDHLVARSGAPSTLGAQLERLRLGTYSTPDPFRAKTEAEDQMMEMATLLRCISDFEARKVLDSRYGVLEKLQRESNLPQGYLALGILRAYQEWAPCIQSSQERGLVAVYQYIAPYLRNKVEIESDDLLQAFRTGKAKRARDRAAEAYADAMLCLSEHVVSWNRKNRVRAVD